MEAVAQKKALPGKELDLAHLSGAKGLAFDALPPGRAFEFGGKLFYLHERALDMVPDSLRWQGAMLGKVAGKGDKATFRPDGMSKTLIPRRNKKGGPDVLDVDNVKIIEQLMTGQSVNCQSGKGPVGLSYRGLPLCWLSRKGKRVLLSSK